MNPAAITQRLPWAKAVDITAGQVLPLLDVLHDDPTRYVTRSVDNHLNDIAKKDPDAAMDRLEQWAEQKAKNSKELARYPSRPGSFGQLENSAILLP